MSTQTPEIAIAIYTQNDPIHVSSLAIVRALSAAGYNAHIVEMDWADDEEWQDLTAQRPVRGGRHAMDRLGSDGFGETYYVGRNDKGQWVREYLDEDVIALHCDTVEVI